MRAPLRMLAAYPHELSGGLAQRAVIAMALARAPKVLIADEPTTALDVTVQAQILELIRQLQQTRGFGVLLISHDMGVIHDHADDVLVMARGSVVERARRATIFAAPRSVGAVAGRLHPHRLRTPAHACAGRPALAISDLRKSFKGGHQVLDGVTLEIAEGDCVGLVGESGSGKTTLARIIAGLERADSGTIVLGGRRVHPVHARARCSTLSRTPIPRSTRAYQSSARSPNRCWREAIHAVRRCTAPRRCWRR